MNARGRYIALEGMDGSGKSTQAELLARHLGAESTKEPGATPLGTHLRDLLLRSYLWPSFRAEALLFAADRAQHISEVVSKLLAQGRDVVTDRSYGSTLAYQGYGRRLPLTELRQLIAFASHRSDEPLTGYELPEVILPDVVILLDIPLGSLRKRASERSSRGHRKKFDGLQVPLFQPEAQERLDNFEHLDHQFDERVWIGFCEICAAEPDRWVRVDGTGSVAEVSARVIEAVSSHPAAQH